jgi:hypothetical protein
VVEVKVVAAVVAAAAAAVGPRDMEEEVIVEVMVVMEVGVGSLAMVAWGVLEEQAEERYTLAC